MMGGMTAGERERGEMTAVYGVAGAAAAGCLTFFCAASQSWTSRKRWMASNTDTMAGLARGFRHGLPLLRFLFAPGDGPQHHPLGVVNLRQWQRQGKHLAVAAAAAAAATAAAAAGEKEACRLHHGWVVRELRVAWWRASGSLGFFHRMCVCSRPQVWCWCASPASNH